MSLLKKLIAFYELYYSLEVASWMKIELVCLYCHLLFYGLLKVDYSFFSGQHLLLEMDCSPWIWMLESGCVNMHQESSP